MWGLRGVARVLPIALGVSVWWVDRADAGEFQAAAGAQHSTETKSRTVSAAYQTDLYDAPDLGVALDLSASLVRQERLSDDSYTIQVWDDRDLIQQKSLGIAPSVEFDRQWGVGVGYFNRSSEVSKGFSAATNVYGWFLHETLRVGASFRRNSDEVESAEYIDVDVARVITPTEITGDVYAGDVTVLAGEQTIVEGSLGRIFRSDRPRADFANVKVRQHVKPLGGSVHLAASLFENRGDLKPISPLGEVRARTYEAQWHQRLMSHMLVVAAYRYNWEEHKRRAEPRETREIGSDFTSLRVGWRFWQDVWTDPATEVYGMVGDYQNSEDAKATTYGVGVRMPLGKAAP